ncbi:DEAD/DEAH box helicase [Scytonema sp. UIC 10036]|uniref:DEAD/DEAH box helicase n=1 Tax=Scytonema sp. UIC 10036 TaxID=2304196 RepID=UPI0012DADBB7|nr:DEAD/DEAH box helicase [Scytonema sp. UIC 10036]MUG95202.1 DEAD/DEAH box helicase [Scytonema sp. UIC 10036]
MFSLRDYQQDLVAQTFAAWDQGTRKVLLQLSTGGGKTVIFAAIAHEFTSSGLGVLVVAHREELILQAADKLAQTTNIEPGIIKAGYKPSDSLIQVASIQTLARRKNYSDAKLVIVDEAHHASAASYRNLLDAYPYALILGVTATPRREDGYGLRDIFDRLICSISTKELIAEGYLTEYKLIAGFKYSKHKVPQKRDFTKKELEEVASDYKPEEVLKQWQNFCNGRKTMIFAVNVVHSKAITAMFVRANIPCEHIDGETPQSERADILERFRTGQTQIISNCAILTEGFDCPDSQAVVIARPTTSVTLWLQMIGRVLRPSPGKEYAIILDMTDNWYRLGRPCDPRNWSLDPVSCDPDAQGVRCCPHCHHVFKPMPALIRSQQYFNSQLAEFVTVYEVDCANCGKSFKWVLSELNLMNGQKMPTIVSPQDIEFLEVPPTIRPSLFGPIIKAKKRKFKNNQQQTDFYLKTVINFLLNCPEITLEELRYAANLLNCQLWIVGHSINHLTHTLRAAESWEEVIKIMSARPQDIKQLIWKKLSLEEQNRFNQMKQRYKQQQQELQEWLSEDNLVTMASDLEACENLEMFASLWQIYNKQALQVALERLHASSRHQILAWIQELNNS